MGRACSQNGGEGRSAFKILAGKPTGKRSLERHRRGWHEYIIMDLKEIGINTKKWVDRDYWRDLLNALNLRVS